MTTKKPDHDLLIELNVRVGLIGEKLDEFINSAKIKYITKVEHNGHDRRLKKLEDGKEWNYRLIVGSIITAAISLVIASRTLL